MVTVGQKEPNQDAECSLKRNQMKLVLGSEHAPHKSLRHIYRSLCFQNHINKWPQNLVHCNHVQIFLYSHNVACPQLNDLLE